MDSMRPGGKGFVKKIGLLILVGLILTSHYGCGHRRICCPTHQAAYHPAHGEAVSNHGDTPQFRTAPLPQPLVAPENSVEERLPSSAPVPVPSAVRVAETKPSWTDGPSWTDEAREPTPADPRTAPQSTYDVADIPSFLRPHQSSPSPQLY